ncbi:MAG TPA: type I methionyl aminopeptidase [Thermoanaerobaculia bacterium]|nr:type I methionyl aminopeptidase [Thermoanaerobaculia bacterium]
MSIENPEELAALRRIGRIVGLAIAEVRAAVRPGVSTAELDAVAEAFLESQGATPAPRQVYGFPGAIMVSVNDEVVHTVPGERRIAPGDVVKIDITASLDGIFADAAATVLVPPSSPAARRLASCVQAAFNEGVRVARAGALLNEVGRRVEAEVRRRGFTVLRELRGHGIGRTIHEAPEVANYYDPHERTRLTEGLVLTLEPLISAGSGKTVLASDGWTIRTLDGSLAAHHEHTLVITRGNPLRVTEV